MQKPEEAYTTGNVSGEGKKKKKRNRKKKSKKSGDDAKSTASSEDGSSQQVVERTPQLVGTVAPSNMNPHAILRNRLMAEGFSERQIDRAMEEMWDKGLAYDEYEAVLKYLKGERDERKQGKDEKKAASTVAAPSASVEDEIEPAAASVPDEPKEVELENTSIPSTGLKVVPPVTMEQRLEMVAAFENLTDSIFALTEWISKAAKPRDLEDLCATTKTKALVTVFRRSITEPEDRSHFDKSILPSMDRLMDSLLSKSGISAAAAAETQSTFEPLLKQARSIYLMQQPDAEDFAGRVSRFIVSRISLALGESNAVANHGSMELVEVPTATSHNNPEGSDDKGIAEMLSRREVNMTAAKRYGLMARAACADLQGRPVAPVNGGSTAETEIDRSDIMLALVGEDAKSSYDLQKADLDELVAQAKTEDSDVAQELRNNIDELNEERESIRKRINELRESIDKLETYDAELCVKMNDAQAGLDEETAQSSAEAVSLNDKIEEATNSIEYGASVSGLVDKLKNYDDSLDKAIQSSKASSAPGVDPAAFAVQQMEVYLSRSRSYFKSEADTMDFLRRRIETSTEAVAELKLEIAECEGLGMNTTIGQMKESVVAKQTLIEKDKAMMDRFSREANSMFETFMVRLDDFKSIQFANALSPLPSFTLSEIRSYLVRLGVESVERLDPFMTTMNGSDTTSPKATDPRGTPKIDGVVAPIGTPKAEAKKVQEKPAGMPKFTWATAKSTGDSSAKPSLLDIQKEELDSKSTE